MRNIYLSSSTRRCCPQASGSSRTPATAPRFDYGFRDHYGRAISGSPACPAAPPSGLLEELPLDVVRVAEADNGGAERIVMQVRGNAVAAQGLR